MLFFSLVPPTMSDWDAIFTARKRIFLHLSVILFTGGSSLPQCMLGYSPGSRPPSEQTPPGADPPPLRGDTPWESPPWEETTPPRSACGEIRSTSGRYASYWNAILLTVMLGRFPPMQRCRSSLDVHYIFQEFGSHHSILSRTPLCTLYSCLVTGNASSTPSAHARPEERGMVCNKLLFLLSLPEREECSHHFGGYPQFLCVCVFF